MSKLIWLRIEYLSSRVSTISDPNKNFCSISSRKKKNVKVLISNNIRSSTSSGMRIFFRPSRRMLKPLVN